MNTVLHLFLATESEERIPDWFLGDSQTFAYIPQVGIEIAIVPYEVFPRERSRQEILIVLERSTLPE